MTPGNIDIEHRAYFILCSQSDVKYRGVEKYLQRNYFEYYHRTIGCNSRVSPQPIGKKETIQGMNNRLTECILKYDWKDYRHVVFVSIENGIYINEEREWVEMVAIGQALYLDGIHISTTVKCTDGVRLNTFDPSGKHIDEVLKMKGQLTFGESLRRENPAIKADEWYNREDFIADSI